MSIPTVTELPDPPMRGQEPAEFISKGDAFLGALPGFATELNGFAQALVEAAAAANYNAASGTSVTIGTGSKVFSIPTGKLFQVGQSVTIASAGDPTNRMFGMVTAHNAITGSLTVMVALTSGAGTHNDWIIALAGPQGVEGIQGPQGDPGTNGTNGVDGASGYELIASAPASGTPVVFANIPVKYDEAVIVFDSVRHGNASATSPGTAVSSDGVTWSSSSNIYATGTTVANTINMRGLVRFVGLRFKACVVYRHVPKVDATDLQGAFGDMGDPLTIRTDNGINHVRVGVTGGFAAGTFHLYGR